MAPQRKRETRENNFYDVGVQGRKTGITLADKGVYDEHGLEPISGIFSSPEKSPPKRASTVTGSESMEIQESSIPDLTTSRQILRNDRTHLPPPLSRSPKKTALGSSPRRQSSMGPRAGSVPLSSPVRETSNPTARRLKFGKKDKNSQETPTLSGSGARRGFRADVYDIPEDDSPVPQQSTILEDSLLQDEALANEDSVVINHSEDFTLAQIGDTTATEAELIEDSTNLDQSEVAPEPVKVPAKRGRKRKSDVLEPAPQVETSATKLRKRTAAHASQPQKRVGKIAPASTAKARRSQRISDITEQEPSYLDTPEDTSEVPSEPVQEAPVAPKRRGRPPKSTSGKGEADAVFKKPSKPVVKPKEKSITKTKPAAKAKEKSPQTISEHAGKLVDAYGNPLSKEDIEQMSTTSVASRFGRGRHLSVFREMDPESIARVGKTGRHRVAPIDFWKNDRIAYDVDGSMTSVVKNQDVEPERKSTKGSGRGRKRALAAIEEEVELDPWEEDEGTLLGNYVDFDRMTGLPTTDVVEDTIAWAEKGIHPEDVRDGSFQYTRLGAVDAFFNWGVIELRADQMKRTKNSRVMHMVWTLQSGTVEVKVHENEFTVHKGGVWQVPRGMSVFLLFSCFHFPVLHLSPFYLHLRVGHVPSHTISARQPLFALAVVAVRRALPRF
ncbi:cupin domain-containing protein [Pyrenochaeta sp. DS3sAY3a]|nr:cupin domain-containing protein [Pyrenochaeta sp. DS3sAY3a]